MEEENRRNTKKEKKKRNKKFPYRRMKCIQKELLKK